MKLIDAWPLPANADTAVGTPDTAAGVTADEAADAALVPIALVAVTVKVYAVPLGRPLTMIGLDEPEPVSPLGLEVTV